MRVAVISDIHGNLAALEAVLADIDEANVDTIVVAGDSVSGPWPAEVFDRLQDVDARIVHGNADRLEEVRRFDDEQTAWNEDRLGPERLAAIVAWPLTLELDVEGLGHVLVCHSTPGSDEPIYTRATPDDEVLGVIGPVEADVFACGHTHMQYDRSLSSGLRMVNPGSVGLPYEGQRGAFWAVLGPDVEFRRSEYDVVKAVAAARALGAPRQDMLELLVDPKSSDEVTAYFESLRGS